MQVLFERSIALHVDHSKELRSAPVTHCYVTLPPTPTTCGKVKRFHVVISFKERKARFVGNFPRVEYVNFSLQYSSLASLGQLIVITLQNTHNRRQYTCRVWCKHINDMINLKYIIHNNYRSRKSSAYGLHVNAHHQRRWSE